ncbi:MAG: RluA family pseudouridine synthase [Kiritimatiellia bacterium]
MHKQPKPFKSPPKKYHPRGLTVLYEDHDLLVVDKRGGLLTIAYREQDPEISVHELLMNYVRKGNSKSRNRVFTVHRLDRDTSGLLVFVKSEAARAYMIEQWPSFTKTYLAVVGGILKEKEGTLTSYLAEDDEYRVASVKNPEEGAFASTGYRVVQESSKHSMLELSLHTGKKNQIRVHLAEAGHPVLGDKKYGDRTPGLKKMALHAFRIEVKHPFTHQPMSFEAPVPRFFNFLMQ